MLFNTYILCAWLLFFFYWGASIIYDAISGNLKRVVKRQPFLSERANAVLLGLAWLLVITTFGQRYPALALRFLPSNFAVIAAGLAISLVGILFAIWARVHLGGNWSGTPVIKRGQTLVRTGPYAMVRNPIYTGITVGIIGSAIAEGTVGGLLAIACVVAFSYFRIRAEEKLLEGKFGRDYRQYKKEVKAFVPWVW